MTKRVKLRNVKMLDLEAINALAHFKLDWAELQAIIEYISNKKNWKKMKISPVCIYDLTNKVNNGPFEESKGWK